MIIFWIAYAKSFVSLLYCEKNCRSPDVDIENKRQIVNFTHQRATGATVSHKNSL